jgi:hypothetical protein
MVEDINVGGTWLNASVTAGYTPGKQIVLQNKGVYSLLVMVKSDSPASSSISGFRLGPNERFSSIFNDTVWVRSESGTTSMAIASLDNALDSTLPASVALSDTVLDLGTGDTKQLTATVSPAGVSQTVTWTSSDPTIATVSNTGLVRSLKKGSVSIKAIATNGVFSSCATTGTQIKAVTQWNSVNKEFDNFGTTQGLLGYWSRVPQRIGDATKQVRLYFYNWIMKDTRNGLCTNPGNGNTVTGCSVEFNGIVKPVTFNGGRTLAMVDGEAGVFADPLKASDFNVTSFPKNALITINTRITIPTGGVLGYSTRESGQTNGSQSMYYNPANTTLSSIDAAGLVTTTGTAPQSRIVMYCPFVLGLHVDQDAVSVLVEGDSIMAGVGDASVQDNIGIGYANRMITAAQVAGLNLGVGGSRAIDGILDPRFTALHKYCTHAMVGYGTNNLEPGVSTTAQSIVDIIKQRIASHQANGINRTLVCKLTPRTTATVSATGWTTLDNQVAQGQALTNQFNTLLDTSGFYGVLQNTAVRAPSNLDLWIPNNTPDGLHPGGNDNGGGHAKLAVQGTSQFTAMIAPVAA